MLRKHEIAWRFLYALRRNANAPKSRQDVVEAVFGGDRDAERQSWMTFQEVEKSLREANLVDRFEDQYELTHHFERIRDLLQFSTLEFSKRTDASAVCTPVFGRPGKEKFDVFVALPFQEQFFRVVDDAVRPACNRRGLSIGFGEDLYSPKSIMHEVWSLIHNARIVIGECTTLNANVFYEVGIAHTLGRHVILLTQDLRELPFDLQHLKTIEYSPDAAGIAALELQLFNWLGAAA